MFFTARRSQAMQGVVVEFQYGDDFDPARVEAIAREARGRFEALPGLRQKAFTVDEPNRRAMNVYLWDSEEVARAFFSDELVERVTDLYGVRPSVSFVEVAELVDNR
jgi:heme-degrading monooxygenase HmoA